MIHSAVLRTQLLTATVPFIVAASQLPGVRRIALLGSLTTSKATPKDVDLLLTVDDTMDLEPLAKLGRKLSGRVTSQAHGNYGVDLFVASSRQRYLGRLCHHIDCPGPRICETAHCGKRPYLRDDLHSVTLEPGLVAVPPLELWPTIIAHRAIPADVELSLLQPLIDQLGLEQSEQIIPNSVRDALILKNGVVDQGAWAALHQAAVFLHVALTEECRCQFIEIHPPDRYASLLFPDAYPSVRRLWVIDLEGKICFVAHQGKDTYLHC